MPSPPEGTLHISMNLDANVKALADQEAEVLDISTNHWIEALIRGAFRTEQAHRMVAKGMEGQTYRKRLGNRLEWTPDVPQVQSSGGQIPAATWHHEDWTMVRLAPGPYATKAAGEGWYLEGPGIDDPPFLGGGRDGAQRKAEAIIRSWKARQNQEGGAHG